MDRGLCRYCHQNPIVGRRRKYCPDHSRNASTLLKRQYRRDWKARGDKYWLTEWKSDEERKAYYRAYMRRYRRRRRHATEAA